MNASFDSPRSDSPALESSSPVAEDHTNLNDEERGLHGRVQDIPLAVHARRSPIDGEEEGESRTQPNSISSSTGAYIKHKTSQLFDAVTSSSQRSIDAPLAPKLAALVSAYAQSSIALDIRAEAEELQREQASGRSAIGNGSNELPDIAAETTMLRGRKRATWATQFRILSGRAFKNLYRDPALLTAHYTSSVALACKFLLLLRTLRTDIVRSDLRVFLS